ncbi:hypothetical protein M0804_013987 [Polistes exclamans]|nr:hypothetical protein M0804_013987 [Polistes exclamans]
MCLQEYSVQLTFREQWIDERLQFNDFKGRLKYLTLTEANRVWMPDLFFANEKEGHFHNIIMPNVYIRIFPNGSVLYSIRISLTLSCPMNLKLYPLDKQICSLRMASYGWTTTDLVFLWKQGDPVQVVKNLHLPRFTLEKFLTDYCNSKTNTGEYSCLKVDLLFKREFSYYLIQIYIPCCMLVIVSWVSFWLDQSAVPARVSLGVTTLLTMATQTSGINASLPPVSYTKAIDIWTGVCLTFVFGALLEFALVNYASRSDMHSDNINKKFPPSEMEHSSSVDPTSEILDADSSANFAMAPPPPPPPPPLPPQQAPTGPSYSPVQTLEDDRGYSPRNSKHSCRSSTRSSQSASPSPSSRTATPSPPSAPVRPAPPRRFHRFPQFSSAHTGRCCWGLLPRGWFTCKAKGSARIDFISRAAFPLMFILFNLAYWSTYLFRGEDSVDSN